MDLEGGGSGGGLICLSSTQFTAPNWDTSTPSALAPLFRLHKRRWDSGHLIVKDQIQLSHVMLSLWIHMVVSVGRDGALLARLCLLIPRAHQGTFGRTKKKVACNP